MSNSQGHDVIRAGGGVDTLVWQRYANAALDVDLATGTARPRDSEGRGSARLTSIETVVATYQDDISRGDGGSNVLRRMEGADILTGRGASDRLFGGLGPDLLRGGRVSDVLYGGGGADTLAGGPGVWIETMAEGA